MKPEGEEIKLSPDKDYRIVESIWVSVGGYSLRISVATDEGGARVVAWKEHDELADPIASFTLGGERSA